MAFQTLEAIAWRLVSFFQCLDKSVRPYAIGFQTLEKALLLRREALCRNAVA